MDFRPVLTLLCVVCIGGAFAESPRELQWEDLAVNQSAPENPFQKLSKEQLEAVLDVAFVVDRKALNMDISASAIASERAARARLEKAGVDVDALLASRKEIAEKQRAIGRAVNTTLDGALARLPGYLLPLEFSGTQVSEFLLVPWVGACIHTPPPPPNQIVHVKLDQPFEFKHAFDAVWVIGRIATKEAKKSVYITDGSADISVGYSMHASKVELYR